MNPITFLLAVWICIGLDLGLSDALSVQLGSAHVTPRFVFVLLAFVAMWAPQSALMGGALALGLLVDVVTPVPTSVGEVTVILGPNAIGFTIAAYTVLNLRALMFRKNVLALSFLSFVSLALASIVAAAILAFRSAVDRGIQIDSATTMLLEGLLSAVYTFLLGFPVGFVLQVIRPVFMFRKPQASFHSGGSARR